MYGRARAQALIFWFFCIKTKERTTIGKNTHPFGKKGRHKRKQTFQVISKHIFHICGNLLKGKQSKKGY